MSAIDERFLRDVFVSQVSTVITLSEARHVDATTYGCGCARATRQRAARGREPLNRTIQCGLAFSLIVNREREHSLDAARIEWCPFCGQPWTCLVPAELEVKPNRDLTNVELAKLRRVVEVEVEAKIRIDSRPSPVNGVYT